MKKQIDNSKAIPILEKNGFEVIQFCKQEYNDDIHQNDTIVITNKHTNSVDTIDCVRALQLLQQNGFEIYYCSIRILIEEGILQRPLGDLIFYRH